MIERASNSGDKKYLGAVRLNVDPDNNGGPVWIVESFADRYFPGDGEVGQYVQFIESQLSFFSLSVEKPQRGRKTLKPLKPTLPISLIGIIFGLPSFQL